MTRTSLTGAARRTKQSQTQSALHDGKSTTEDRTAWTYTKVVYDGMRCCAYSCRSCSKYHARKMLLSAFICKNFRFSSLNTTRHNENDFEVFMMSSKAIFLNLRAFIRICKLIHSATTSGMYIHTRLSFWACCQNGFRLRIKQQVLVYVMVSSGDERRKSNHFRWRSIRDSLWSH